MKIETHLDVEVVALETDDEVSVLVELTAPIAAPADPAAERPTRTLQVVVDRSGSMEGRIQGAVQALTALVDRLDPKDNFGVVAFDNQVELTVPAGPLASKPTVKAAIRALFARGGTNLSSGYLRGIQEARRVAGKGGATLLLVSDGHANEGVTDPAALGGIAAEAYRKDGVVTSTLGWGEGYDERLMSAIARGGSGNEGYAAQSDAAVAFIGGEVEGLLSQTAQAASLLIKPCSSVRAVSVLNELPTTAAADGIIAELGTFYSGETRKIVLTFSVPSVASLGLTRIATLEVRYVGLPALKEHTVNVPLHVNVVPGDEAAGRVPNPVVRTEVVYQQVQKAKRTASDHLIHGRYDDAVAELNAAEQLLQDRLQAGVPAQLEADLRQEVDELQYLNQSTRDGRYSHSSKYLSSSSTMKSRHRGRNYNYNQPPTAPPPEEESTEDDQTSA